MLNNFLEEYKTWEKAYKNYSDPKIKSLFEVLHKELEDIQHGILSIDQKKYIIRSNRFDYFVNCYKIYYFCLINVQFLQRFQLQYFLSKFKYEEELFIHDSSFYDIYRNHMKYSLILKESDLQIDLFD